MSTPSLQIVAGMPISRAVQCYVYGSGTVAAIYNSTDILSAAVIQSRQTSPIFTPTVAWYTVSSQTGYGQGQVEFTFTTAQALLLVPYISYTLDIYRALVSDSTHPEMIARIPLVILPLAA